MPPCLTHDVSYSGTVLNALDIPAGVECCRTAFSNCILVHFSGKLFPTMTVLLFRPLLDHELNRPTLLGNPFVRIEVTFLVSPAVRTPNPKKLARMHMFVSPLHCNYWMPLNYSNRCSSGGTRKIKRLISRLFFSIASANSRCVSPLCSGVNTYQILTGHLCHKQHFRCNCFTW